MKAFHTGRVLISLLASAVSFLTFLSPASAAISGYQDISVIHHSVSGNAGNSFYPSRDWDYLTQGSLRFQETAKDREYTGAFDYTYTDDRTQAPAGFNIERMYFGLKQGTTDFLLGDYYARFSPYTLDNALKGIRIGIGDPEVRRLTIAAGIDTPLWRNLTDDAADHTQSKRYVWGLRLENPFADGRGAINLNYAGALDDTDFTPPFGTPMQVNVFSVDGHYAFTEHLTGYGELAASLTDEDIRQGSSQGTKTGIAGKLGLQLRTERYSLDAEYNRAGKDFYAAGGFSARDQEWLTLNGKLALPGDAAFGHYIRIGRENISGGEAQVREINPGGSLSLRLPWELSLDLNADLLRRVSRDRSTDSTATTLGAHLGRQFGPVQATLGYSHTMFSNRADITQSRDIDAVTAGLSGGTKIRNVDIGWNVSERAEFSGYHKVSGSDTVTSTSLGLKAVFPSSLAVEARAQLGSGKYAQATDSASTDLYLGISRSITKDASVSLTCEHKRNTFEQSINNYAETTVKASVRYTF
ncbi:MAG: hypothetical protein ACM3OC_03455 [Deltaproteobacteria bacterium]